jgi:DNA polymerase/3'-5' exonuclease PolX
MTNHQIALALLSFARSMTRQTNLYRQRSYRQAAIVVQGLDDPVTNILSHRGRHGLASIPGIGEHLAYTIETYLRCGRVVPWSDRDKSAMS